MSEPIVTTPTISDLPADIIEHIFLKLPIRSLAVSKCVRRSWNALISSKDFIYYHLKISKEDATFARRSMVFVDCSRPFPVHQCPFLSLLSEVVVDEVTVFDIPTKDNDTVEIVGCCNGIVCIVSGNRYIYMFNPVTGEFNKLPELDDDELLPRFYITNLGFGFDEDNEDYKVMCFMKSAFAVAGKNTTTLLRVYSLKSNTWKRMGMLDRYLPTEYKGKFLNGKLYWRRTSREDDIDTDEMVCFDLVSGFYRKVQLPTCCYGMRRGYSLHCSVGSLSVLCDNAGIGLDIWIFRQHGMKESWDRVACLPYLDRCFTYPLRNQVCIGPNGKIPILTAGSFKIYDLKHNSFKHVEIVESSQISDADVYVESLVRLH